jgi:hypothetical protein
MIRLLIYQGPSPWTATLRQCGGCLVVTCRTVAAEVEAPGRVLIARQVAALDPQYLGLGMRLTTKSPKTLYVKKPNTGC